MTIGKNIARTSPYYRNKDNAKTTCKRHKTRPRRRVASIGLLENNLIRRVSFEEYREKVRDVYDGPQGAMLADCSLISLHTMMGERLFRERKFDLRGMRNILDVGSGAGQIAKHLLKYADPKAELTCFDLSHEMLRRARTAEKRPAAVRGGRRLPGCHSLDETFDCVTCGYVLEHVPDAEGRAGRAKPGDDPRGADAAFGHRGQLFRGLHQSACGDAGPIIAANWPGFARKWDCAGTRSFGIPACIACCGPAAYAWNW